MVKCSIQTRSLSRQLSPFRSLLTSFDKHRFLDKAAYEECDHDGPSFVFATFYTVIFMGIGVWLLLAFLPHRYLVMSRLTHIVVVYSFILLGGSLKRGKSYLVDEHRPLSKPFRCCTHLIGLGLWLFFSLSLSLSLSLQLKVKIT